jgi:hypothetical protein
LGVLPARWCNIEKRVWALIRAIDISRIFRSGKAVSGGAVVESRRVAGITHETRRCRLKLHNSWIVGNPEIEIAMRCYPAFRRFFRSAGISHVAVEARGTASEMLADVCVRRPDGFSAMLIRSESGGQSTRCGLGNASDR